MQFIKAFSAHPDVVICLLISIAIGILVSKMVPSLVNEYYDKRYGNSSERTGETATLDTVKAESIEDILSADRFAIVVDDKEKWQYDASASIDDIDTAKMYNIKLASGEHVAVRVRNQDAYKIGSTYLLPVGKTVTCDMNEDKEVLSELEKTDKLDRYDFYVDARKDLHAADSEYNREKVIEWLTPVMGFLTICILWPLLHIIVVKIGLASALLFGKRK